MKYGLDFFAGTSGDGDETLRDGWNKNTICRDGEVGMRVPYSSLLYTVTDGVHELDRETNSGAYNCRRIRITFQKILLKLICTLLKRLVAEPKTERIQRRIYKNRQ